MTVEQERRRTDDRNAAHALGGGAAELAHRRHLLGGWAAYFAESGDRLARHANTDSAASMPATVSVLILESMPAFRADRPWELSSFPRQILPRK